MPEVRLNDIDIHYERVGHGAPVMLLHGLGSSSLDWEHQMGVLAERFDVIAPDFRGHGKSEKPSGPYSMSLWASDIQALVDHLGLGPVTVVGLSLGGMVGFQLTADRPDLVVGLIAVNSLPAFETNRVSQKIQVAIRKVITKRMSMEKIGQVLAKRLFPDPSMEEQRETMVERWARNDKRAYEDSFAAILAWDGVALDMKETTVPVTVISSEFDYLSTDDKRPYVDPIPGARLLEIEGAHHAVPAEHPERFNDVLIQALG